MFFYVTSLFVCVQFPINFQISHSLKLFDTTTLQIASLFAQKYIYMPSSSPMIWHITYRWPIDPWLLIKVNLPKHWCGWWLLDGRRSTFQFSHKKTPNNSCTYIHSFTLNTKQQPAVVCIDFIASMFVCTRPDAWSI